MSQLEFFESEAILEAFAKSKGEIDIEFNVSKLIEQLEQTNADTLNDYIVKLLDEKEFHFLINKVETIPPPHLKKGYGLRLREVNDEKGITKMYFFKVNKSIEASAVSIVALAVALLFFNPAGVIPAFGIFRSAWKNLVTLKRDEHKPAILVYQAILKIQLKLYFNSLYSPSTKEIQSELKDKDAKNIEIGLSQLLDRRLIKCTKWGDVHNDYSNLENRWEQEF